VLWCSYGNRERCFEEPWTVPVVILGELCAVMFLWEPSLILVRRGDSAYFNQASAGTQGCRAYRAIMRPIMGNTFRCAEVGRTCGQGWPGAICGAVCPGSLFFEA